MSVSIRPATKDDISDIAEIHVSGWRTSGAGIVDQAYLDGLQALDRELEWKQRFEESEVNILLAFQDDVCVGFVNYGPLRTAPPGTSKIRPQYTSEIYAIYLKPEYFRKGMGRVLLKEAVTYLGNEKHQSLCLWVLKGNKRACAFYDAMGGKRIGKKFVEIGPTKTQDVCYGWRSIKDILERS